MDIVYMSKHYSMNCCYLDRQSAKVLVMDLDSRTGLTHVTPHVSVVLYTPPYS